MKNLKKFESVFEELPDSWVPDGKSMQQLGDHIVRKLGIDFDLDVAGLPYNNAFIIPIGKQVLNGIMGSCSVMVDAYLLQIAINHANTPHIWEVDINVSGDKFNSWEDVYDELHPIVEHWFSIDREVRRMQRETQDKFYEMPVVESPVVQQYKQE